MSQTAQYAPTSPPPAQVAPWLGPKVDLTPAVIREDAKVAKAKGLMVVCALGAAAVVGGLYLLAAGSQSAAQADLDSATAEAAALQTQAEGLAEVPRTAAALATAERNVSTAMAGDVRWSAVLNDLALTTPRGVAFQTVTLAPAASGATAATSTLPDGAIGALSFSGEALSYPSIAEFLDVLARQRIYADPTLLSSTRGGPGGTSAGGADTVTFQANAAVTDEALSHRYDPTTGGTK